MAQILLVEDDPILGDGIRLHLELEGYKVEWTRSLASALAVNQSLQIDIILLDLGLPDGNGLNLCHTLRAAGSRIPIIILSAQTDDAVVVEGLNAGANDYVRKPFSNKELIARVRRALREPLIREDQARFGQLVLLLDKRIVLHNGQEIDFNRREFDILLAFVTHAETVLTRNHIINVLNPDSDISDRTVDSHVSHVRKRLRDAGVTDIKIRSEYGIGYRLTKENN